MKRKIIIVILLVVGFACLGWCMWHQTMMPTTGEINPTFLVMLIGSQPSQESTYTSLEGIEVEVGEVRMDPDTVTVTFTVRIEENQTGTLLKALRLEEEGPFSGDLDKISSLREAIRAKGEATTTVRFPIPGKDPPWTLRLELERSNGRTGLAEAEVKPYQVP